VEEDIQLQRESVIPFALESPAGVDTVTIT
jgi:hypothetical protein